MHGLAVTTIEGIGSVKTILHPVQERIAKAHGSQCGFCTPGIIMSMYALLRTAPKPSMKDLEIAFQGNITITFAYYCMQNVTIKFQLKNFILLIILIKLDCFEFQKVIENTFLNRFLLFKGINNVVNNFKFKKFF